jgi:3-oxoacyl-[acyl-carrier protein] reductase
MSGGALAGRVSLVTGASRGIGRAIAIELARQGATVVLAARDAARLDEAVTEIVAAGGQGAALSLDIADRSSIEAAFAKLLETHGRLDHLVNNAGITRDNLVLRMKPEDWQQVIDTNLGGAFYCIQAALKPMLKQRSGRIVNITSVVGLAGNAGQANYAASKAGLIGLTKSVAREVASRSITVNAVAPGFIETDMTAAMTDDAKKTLFTQIPLERLGKPSDIASLVTFLASEQSSYITGQVFVVDGGMVM